MQDLEILLDEWKTINNEYEFSKNRLIFYSKKLVEQEKQMEELYNILEKMKEKLNDTEYTIFFMRFIEKKKIIDIAVELEYSETHIKRFIRKIKNKLK